MSGEGSGELEVLITEAKGGLLVDEDLELPGHDEEHRVRRVAAPADDLPGLEEDLGPRPRCGRCRSVHLPSKN